MYCVCQFVRECDSLPTGSHKKVLQSIANFLVYHMRVSRLRESGRISLDNLSLLRPVSEKEGNLMANNPGLEKCIQLPTVTVLEFSNAGLWIEYRFRRRRMGVRGFM